MRDDSRARICPRHRKATLDSRQNDIVLPTRSLMLDTVNMDPPIFLVWLPLF